MIITAKNGNQYDTDELINNSYPIECEDGTTIYYLKQPEYIGACNIDFCAIAIDNLGNHFVVYWDKTGDDEDHSMNADWENPTAIITADEDFCEV